MQLPRESLEAISRRLQQLHAVLLETEKQFHPALPPLALLDRLMNDPAWAWLRPLSMQISDIDHVLAQEQAPTQFDLAVVAAHARALLAAEGDLQSDASYAAFRERYHALLQLNPALVSQHGQLKALLKSAPAETENEAERLHARHQWAERCKHQRIRS
jgi:hypothetical protein